MKLPEPLSLLHCHTAQEDCHYTEAQYLQGQRDALEAALSCYSRGDTGLALAEKIRNLQKEIV